MPKKTKTNANCKIVCKLPKTLYGLKQSPRLWYKRLVTFLINKLGLKEINADHSIFMTKTGLDGPVVCNFVNNIKVMAPKESEMMERVRTELTSACSIVDIGPLSFYLGLKVQHNRENRRINLLQPAYIDKVLAKIHLNKFNAVNSSMRKTAIFE